MKCEWAGPRCVSDAIPAVVELLSSESLVLREAATQALSSLTHGNQLNALWVPENLTIHMTFYLHLNTAELTIIHM